MINYLTNTEDIVENVVVENVNVSNKGGQPIEANIIINEAGI